ncbi:RibD C-terminal domain-containing protein [Rathayibacter oskolensis]|uniref:RibD C-terminal domain-containing protein n=1 Tax=Rathayibacter oskolensis TaxID=1891671 RepID=A0A1X7NJE3_9MICO|nr:dihydrofolate reductase family protein [Rathayibacter oskolensis]SMH37121.1 RibD C-terminal domain-containing protein [Rathayibacter oskolensis]
MSRLVVSVLTSLDGYYEGPDHDLSTLPFEDAFNDHNLALLRRAGTLVYGSRWFRDNWDSWSAVAADDSAGDRDREIARLVTTLDSLVISDSLSHEAGAAWAASTRIVPREGAAAEIRALKAAGDRDLLMFGSGTTWNPLLELGLVDELIVLVGAGLAGGGSPLYSGPPHPGLTLLDAAALPGSELVRLRYDVSSR